MDEDDRLKRKVATVWPHLNERQRRLLLAAEAQALGYGGITRVARAAAVSRPTLQRGLLEVDHPDPGDRVRQRGGGRQRLQDHDPTLLAALEALVEPTTRGDPMSPLRWTSKRTNHLAAALTAQGHPISAAGVRRLLHAADSRVQAPAKVLEGGRHPDRAAQFHSLHGQITATLARGLPVIAVDTKKKELGGRSKHGGREWPPAGDPEPVQDHAFPDPVLGKAIPYGGYALGRKAGWVTVGQDHDTASCAVASLLRGWAVVGQPAYPRATRLLISADGGGSNGDRTRLWTVELQRFATTTGLTVTVCHLPPGTSKWNTIEHRLFAHISLNWRGRPLVSHEVIVNLIGATTTQAGLTVQAARDTGRDPTKVPVSDEAMAALPLPPHAFHGEWNYTSAPAPAEL